MATELFSISGFQTGWLSQHGKGYTVSAELDGLDIWYWSTDYKEVQKAFSRACLRTFLRRFFPWLAPPKIHLGTSSTYSNTMTIPDERTRAIVYTRQFLEQLLVPGLTPDVPDSVRTTARSLLRHYPGISELEIAHLALPDWFGPARTAEDRDETSHDTR